MHIFATVTALCIQGWETRAFSIGQSRVQLGANQRQQEFRSFFLHGNQRPLRPLHMATIPDLDSSDPFAVLGLDPNDGASLDKKVIKRAYKRLALKYHPDVATNKDSSSEEKKRASDQFAKINAAYQTLLGNRQGNSASSSSSSGSGGWTPPHRRKPGESSYTSSYDGSSGKGTSWEDFMPNYDDQYDAGGDSFGAIFGDLLAGAAGAVGSRGGAGIFMDFVEFLESNVDGYSGVSGSSAGRKDDAELTFLLQTGTVDEVGEEVDDTELVVQQLTTKLKDLNDELVMIQADLAASTRFSKKIALEEREAECQARKGVVENYLQRGRKRLLALQTRYKELIVGGQNNSRAGGRSTRQSWNPEADARSTSTGNSNSRRASSSDPGDAWKTEGFGSNGRSRGSGRRRSSRSSQTRSEQSTSSSSASSSQYQSTDYFSQETQRQSNSYSSSRSTPPPYPQTTTDNYVPPHRRTSCYQAKDDTERLRQLKVEDEFEKLKRDLGL